MTETGQGRLRRHLPSAAFVVLAALGVGAVAAGIVYAGVYDIGADTPHSKPVYWMIEQFRDRSIAARAKDVSVPSNLMAVARVQSGAGLYAEMCSGCHLAPGMEKTEISQGLYPAAPELFRASRRSAQEQFWIIKHGVKLTAMPAWGKTHGDALIWDMVAFVRKLPGMTPAQYKAVVASAPEDHDAMMKDMPNMEKATP